MSRSLNKTALIGNVGSDPDVRSTQGNNKVAKFSLATSETFTDRSGQKQEKTQWHRITVWGKLADVVEQYVKKGDRVYVEGKIEYSETENDAGVKRYWTDIIARELIMLGGKSDGARTQATETPTAEYDDEPF